MAITYPLSLPASGKIIRMDFRREARVGVSESPFTFSSQSYVWAGDRWMLTIEWGPLYLVADANDIEGFLLALNGREGSFLAGDLTRPLALGTWVGQSPLVKGASQTGKTLLVDGLTPTTTTCLKGDFFQLGSGATSRLHRLTQNSTANGAGEATLDFWPQLRASPADNAPLTLAAPKGLFMLAENISGWSLHDTIDDGISIDCIEDLRGI
jgi:hypothetical protein